MESWYQIQTGLIAAIICMALAINVLLRGRENELFRRFAWFNLNLLSWFLIDALTLGEVLSADVGATGRALVPESVVALGPSEASCELPSAKWLQLGFQGDDPATDFRGMGVLGLQNLVYFGEHYPEVFQRLVSKQRKRDYPLACAGINVTAMLVDLLRLRDCDGGEVAGLRELLDGRPAHHATKRRQR